MNFNMLPDTIKISKMSGCKPNACSCNKCSDMCRRQVCIGTPNDMLTVANNGFSEYLVSSLWLVGLQIGIPPMEMVQIKFDTKKRRCSMLTDEGLCKLHDLGLKPTEGVLSSMHHNSDKEMKQGYIMYSTIIALWTAKWSQKTVRIL